MGGRGASACVLVDVDQGGGGAGGGRVPCGVDVSLEQERGGGGGGRRRRRRQRGGAGEREEDRQDQEEDHGGRGTHACGGHGEARRGEPRKGGRSSGGSPRRLRFPSLSSPFLLCRVGWWEGGGDERGGIYRGGVVGEVGEAEGMLKLTNAEPTQQIPCFFLAMGFCAVVLDFALASKPPCKRTRSSTVPSRLLTLPWGPIVMGPTQQ